MKNQPIYIAVDFDGTLVRYACPDIGEEIEGAFQTLRDLQKRGHKLILLTARSGPSLSAAADFCSRRGISFYDINNNPSQKKWSSSPKVFANVYIDDLALGCPVVNDGGKDFVDWVKVRELLKEKGLL